MMTRILVWGLSALLSVVLVGCGRSEAPAPSTESQAPAAPEVTTANVTAERLLNAAAEPSQWMTYGGTYDEYVSATGREAPGMREL